MKTKDLVFMSLLLAIGTVLHSVVPGLLFGMKPDMLLTMMFLGIMLFPHIKNVVVLGVGAGVISALTTGFPSGQIPNMIDKPITALVFFGLFLLLKKINKNIVVVGVLTAIGTIISGTIFLSSALAIVGLPSGTSFLGLFIGVVLTTAVVNVIVMVIVYPIVTTIKKRTNFN